MKKMLLVTLDYLPDYGGVAKYYSELRACLKPRKTVVLAPPLKSGQKEIGSDYTVKRKAFFYRFFWPQWIRLVFVLGRVIKKETIETVWAGQVLPVGTAVWLSSLWHKRPYFVSLHGMDVVLASRSFLKRFLFRLILGRARAITANSLFTRDRAHGLGVKKEIKVIYPGVETEIFDLSRKVDEIKVKHGLKRKKIVLSLSRIVERKGFADMIRAWPQIIKQVPDAVYILAGRGDFLSVLKEKTRQLGLENSIIFMERVDDSFKGVLFALCDVFAMPCFEKKNRDVEGFGIVYLEAGVYGKPVIAGRSGGAVEAVKDGETGFVVEPGNIEEIVKRTVELLTNRDLAQKMGKKGKQRAEEDFSWEKQGQAFKEWLNLMDI